MAKTYLEKLGLEPVNKLNKKICRERITHLNKIIKTKKVTGRLLKQARYYAYWYAWLLKNNGSRSLSK